MYRGILLYRIDTGGYVFHFTIGMEEKRMTYSDANKRITLLCILLLMGCCLMVAPVAANPDVTHVTYTIEPGKPGVNDYSIVCFHINTGLTPNNGIFITFDQNTVVDDPFCPSCVNITYDGWSLHPTWVKVIHNPDPEYAQYGFPDGTTTLKMDVPRDIPFNNDVCVNFTCGLEYPCPINCSGYHVWANTDVEPKPVLSNNDYLQVFVDAIPPSGGTITPEGREWYDCGDTPTYTISPGKFYDCERPVVWIGESEDPINVTSELVQVGSNWTYTFDPLHCSWWINATFARCPPDITVCLKYQVPKEECGFIDVICPPWMGYNTINDALNFTDDLYVGGDSANFTLLGSLTLHDFGTYDGGWIPGSPLGENTDVYILSAPENETFKITYNKNDGSQYTATVLINSSTISIPLDSDVVKVVNIVGAGSGSSPGYDDQFQVQGSSTLFGTYNGGFIPGASLGEGIAVTVNTAPASNPETYRVTYTGDDATSGNLVYLILLSDGITKVWVPSMPTNVVDVTDVQSQQFAWDLHTQCWIDSHPEFGGLVGAQVLVTNGTYPETFEMDTPGVVLMATNTGSPAGGAIIDAYGIMPAFNNTEFPDHTAAVLITAGCTEFNGFTVKDAGQNVGGSPDLDGNGLIDAAGIAVHPSSWKCEATLIDNDSYYQTSCHFGRVNIINNTVFGSTAEGILANDTVILVEGNNVYDNCWDGFAGEMLHCGVECVDPFAITHCPIASSEILYNEFHDNGCGDMSTWVGQDCINKSWTSFSTAYYLNGGDPFWIDSGIEIRSVQCCDPQDGQFSLNGKGCTMPNIQPSLVFSDPFIIGNKIYNNTHAGINLLEEALPDDCNTPVIISIIENKIHNNGVFGISSFVDDASEPVQIPFDGFTETERLVIKYNDITGNTWWGIKNFVGIAGPVGNNDDIIAKENWWGKIGGPSKGPLPICHEPDQQSMALGNGDAVSHHVHYNPWLTQTYCVVMANDPVRWYGSDTLELQEGWNTLSVPLTLDDRADNITEIGTLGCFLTGENFVVAYQFNANTHLFEPISPNFIPARGYYIKMKEATRFPVLYSGSESPGLPAFPLSTGWNLVGSAFGIDRIRFGPYEEGRWAVADPDGGGFGADFEAAKMVVDALDSLESEVPRGLSTVVSPSVPGQISSWSASENNLGGKRMYTGEGYWVYMVNPGTLSGFEITPFHFTFDLDGFGCVCPGVAP